MDLQDLAGGDQPLPQGFDPETAGNLEDVSVTRLRPIQDRPVY
jgi:hypothetical protein